MHLPPAAPASRSLDSRLTTSLTRPKHCSTSKINKQFFLSIHKANPRTSGGFLFDKCGKVNSTKSERLPKPNLNHHKKSLAQIKNRMNDQDMSIHNQQKDIHPRKKISTKLLTLLCKREFIARNKSLFTGDFCTRLYTQLLLENRKSEAKLLILSIIENLSGDSILIEKILAAAAENLDIHTCKQATKLLIQKNIANGLIIRFEEGIIAHDYALRSSISSTWDAYLFKSFKKQKNLLKADISKLKSIKKQIFFCSSSLSSSKKNTTHNLQNTGYIFNKCTIQEEQCNVMVETFKTANNLINDELITLLNRQKVIESYPACARKNWIPTCYLALFVSDQKCGTHLQPLAFRQSLFRQ